MRCKLWGTWLLLATLIGVAAAFPTENVVAIAFLFAALTLLGVPWHWLRLRFLRACQAEGPEFYQSDSRLEVHVNTPASANADTAPQRAAESKRAARSSAVARPTSNSFTAESRQV